ncbi:MAG: AbrB/MazE/SpoVT family DNA-binding domain-containing protein [Desulfobacteraceae bacterium]|nr:AbrB/MazE/SpoVT family DNA-binding domain-containing protein [Desulfobacteraceae bacterium]
MRITSKGQVTIPLEVREKFGLLPHTEVEFEGRKDGVYLRKVESAKQRGDRLVRHLRGKATARMSTDQIMALTREEE